MPHLILETSADLAAQYDLAAILEALFDTACETGIVMGDDLKLRAYATETYLVAGTKMPFVHLTLRFLEGRDPETKLALSQALLGVLTKGFPNIERISVDIREMDAFAYKKRPYDNPTYRQSASSRPGEQ